MGATVPASPILRRPRPASFSQAPIVSEAKPTYVAPMQKFTSLATLAAEPTPPSAPKLAPLPPQQMARARRFSLAPARTTRQRFLEY